MEIKVGYKLYRVLEVKEDEMKDGEDGEYIGTCDFKEMDIKINASYPDFTKRACLIHELLHALDDMYFIELTEKQVTTLANAMYTAITDNPNLISKILEQ
jgi:hypothetical protein